MAQNSTEGPENVPPESSPPPERLDPTWVVARALREHRYAPYTGICRCREFDFEYREQHNAHQATAALDALAADGWAVVKLPEWDDDGGLGGEDWNVWPCRGGLVGAAVESPLFNESAHDMAAALLATAKEAEANQ